MSAKFSSLSVIALLLAGAADVAAARHRHHDLQRESAAGQFDYYLLSLSWSPAFCIQQPNAAECNGPRRFAFIVHGLWPQNELGWPQNCGGDSSVPAAVVQGIADLMPAAKLVYHEWSAHGTCSGLDPQAYFALLRKARASIVIPAQLAHPSAVIEQAPGAIVGEFLEANPQLPNDSLVVTCSHQGAPRLRELHVCFDRELGARACSADARREACRADTVIVTPVRLSVDDMTKNSRPTALIALALIVLAGVRGHVAWGDAAARAATPVPAIRVETGSLTGASYRIDMPEKWNGVLLMYYHGYSETAVSFDKAKANPLGSAFAAAGYAVAQSGYSIDGWAVERAIPETEALREYTIAHYGRPKEVYVLGHSMGGQLTIATIESYPNRYDGALPLCALLQPTSAAVGRGGALVAAFNFYYPGLLPEPLNIGTSVLLDDALVKKVLTVLPTNPIGRGEILALGRFKTDEDLAMVMVFYTYIQRDFEQKIGASVLDNHNVVYAGGADDNALNIGVKRYTASAAALSYLKTWYTPTGVLLRPTLAVHTTYDPIIPADTLQTYSDTVQRAGGGENFVQQYVAHDGHCKITGAETAAALEELIRWKRTGVKPGSGAVPAVEQSNGG